MNAQLPDAPAIELFHLAFLRVLQGRLNQDLYVLKGGANLRYFFESVRYSEDIDLDAHGIEAWKLEETVDGVLESPALKTLLRGGRIAIAEISKPKQTDTTQRWKLGLSLPGRDQPLRTKIEFSRRNGDRRRLLEAVPDRVVAPYALRPPTLFHYTAAPAIEQKIKALALRMETQARDVFDLELLFREHRDVVEVGTLDPATLKAAIGRCRELPFEAFEAHVVPFLEPDVADLYDNPSSWEQTRSFVIDRLTELV